PRRLAFLAAALFMIWFFFTHRLSDLLPHRVPPEQDAAHTTSHGRPIVQPSEGLPSAFGQRTHHTLDDSYMDAPRPPPPSQNLWEKPDKDKDSTRFYYQGKLVFSSLSRSMHNVGSFQAYRQPSRNVLFAVA